MKATTTIQELNLTNTNPEIKVDGYFLTQRPPGIGTHPVGAVSVEEIYFKGRTSYLLKYDRELTIDEMRAFELTPNIQFDGRVRIDGIIFDATISEAVELIYKDEVFTESLLDFYESVKEGIYELL